MATCNHFNIFYMILEQTNTIEVFALQISVLYPLLELFSHILALCIHFHEKSNNLQCKEFVCNALFNTSDGSQQCTVVPSPQFLSIFMNSKKLYNFCTIQTSSYLDYLCWKIDSNCSKIHNLLLFPQSNYLHVYSTRLNVYL